ncbi:DUF2059 domain-containing protein [Nitratifractor sp.]
MIKTTLKFTLSAMLLLGGSSLMAEQAKAPTAKTPKMKPLTPEAEKAAYKLFDALNMTREGIRKAMEQSLALQVKRQPAMAPYVDIYKKAFDKYIQWDQIKKELAKIVSQTYTPKEMNELAKFYSTDLGKKSMMLVPVLGQLSKRMAEAQIAKHAKEIRAEVDQRAKALEAAAKKAQK